MATNTQSWKVTYIHCLFYPFCVFRNVQVGYILKKHAAKHKWSKITIFQSNFSELIGCDHTTKTWSVYLGPNNSIIILVRPCLSASTCPNYSRLTWGIPLECSGSTTGSPPSWLCPDYFHRNPLHWLIPQWIYIVTFQVIIKWEVIKLLKRCLWKNNRTERGCFFLQISSIVTDQKSLF